jgi:transposase
VSQEILPEGLWRVVQPLLPPPKPRPKGGRPPLDNRKVLTGIIFVLKTGIPWEYLPKECGWGTGMTCLNRLRAWQEAGVWEKLHHVLLEKLGEADRIDWSRASIDSAAVPAPRGARTPAPTRRTAASRAPSAILS